MINCWEKNTSPKILYHCYQYLFFLQYMSFKRATEMDANENHSYFWWRPTLTWPRHGGEVESPAVKRGPERCFSVVPGHPN